MIRIEQYKLFHNSKDFEKIYNKSISDIRKYFNGPYETFYSKIVLPSLANNYCFILFDDNDPIGYEIVKITNKKIDGGFTFILPEHRGKKYSFLLRERMFELLKDKVDSFTTYIHNSNISSIQSAIRAAQKLNLSLYISDTIILNDGTNTKMKKYTIN